MNVAGRGVKSTLPLHGLTIAFYLSLCNQYKQIYSHYQAKEIYALFLLWFFGVLNRQPKTCKTNTIRKNVLKHINGNVDKTALVHILLSWLF